MTVQDGRSAAIWKLLTAFLAVLSGALAWQWASAASMPKASGTYGSTRCHAAALTQTGRALGRSDHFRQAATYLLRAEAVTSETSSGTLGSAVNRYARVKLMGLMHRRAVTELLCETGWVRRADGAVIASLPGIVAALRPARLSEDEAYDVAVCMVFRRHRLPRVVDEAAIGPDIRQCAAGRGPNDAHS